VVDPHLRVNGVRNLRIADSIIMPRIVAVPTMPACVFIGLRMAELLTQGASHR
jgi:choline dehydrogenase